MPKKFYVVWNGKKPGIYTSWDTCKEQIDGFAGARYKSFKSRDEAEAAYRSNPRDVLGKAKAAPKKAPPGAPKTYSAAEVADFPADIKIFTDGGCEPNPGKAASGVAVYREGRVDELWFGLFNPRGTNNTAELNGLHRALLMAERETAGGASVAVFCDSRYSIQCITQWAFNWERRGWVKKDGEIKNLELIQETFAVFKRLRSKVKILHVNGHVGVEGNELADRMSIHGIDSREEDFVAFPIPDDLKQVLAMRSG